MVDFWGFMMTPVVRIDILRGMIGCCQDGAEVFIDKIKDVG